MDERVPGEYKPAGGEEAKPRHQGEEDGQPEPVACEQRQGPETIRIKQGILIVGLRICIHWTRIRIQRLQKVKSGRLKMPHFAKLM